MNRSPLSSHDLTDSSPSAKTSRDDVARELPSPNTSDLSSRMDAAERLELIPDSHAPALLDTSGNDDEAQGLQVLGAIIFGILIMAILGAIITLAFVAN